MTITDPLLAPGTAWLRKALGEVSLHIPFEKPVTEGLNSLRISEDHKTRKGDIMKSQKHLITNHFNFLVKCK